MINRDIFHANEMLVHKEIAFIDFPQIDIDMKTKDKDFIPFMGAAGYARNHVIDYCNEKKTEFITYLKSVESSFGIEAKTHNFVKLNN